MTTLHHRRGNATIVIRPVTRTLVHVSPAPTVIQEQDGNTAVIDRNTSNYQTYLIANFYVA